MDTKPPRVSPFFKISEKEEDRKAKIQSDGLQSSRKVFGSAMCMSLHAASPKTGLCHPNQSSISGSLMDNNCRRDQFDDVFGSLPL